MYEIYFSVLFLELYITADNAYCKGQGCKQGSSMQEILLFRNVFIMLMSGFLAIMK